MMIAPEPRLALATDVGHETVWRARYRLATSPNTEQHVGGLPV